MYPVCVSRQEITIKDDIEVPVALWQLPSRRLEITLRQFGLNEEIASAQVYFRAINPIIRHGNSRPVSEDEAHVPPNREERSQSTVRRRRTRVTEDVHEQGI